MSQDVCVQQLQSALWAQPPFIRSLPDSNNHSQILYRWKFKSFLKTTRYHGKLPARFKSENSFMLPTTVLPQWVSEYWPPISEKDSPYGRVEKKFFVSKSFETYCGFTLSVCTSRISTPSLMVIRCHAAEQYCRNIFIVLSRGSQEKFCDKIKIWICYE